MARKQTITLELPAENASVKPEETEVAEDSQDLSEQELQSALAEIGDTEVKVQVVKTLPKDDAGACTSYSAQEFSIERVRDDWGGGTYMLYFRLPNGTLKTKRRINILARKVPVAPPDRTGEIIEALKRGSPVDTVLPLLFQAMQSQAKSQSDMMTAIINAQGANKSQPLGVTEIVALMTSLQTLSKSKDDTDGLDKMLKLIKVAKELGDGGGGSSTAEVIMAGIQAAKPMLENLGKGASQSAHPIQATVVRTPAVVPGLDVPPEHEKILTPDEPVEDNVNLNSMIWMRAQLAKLIEKAKKQKDAQLYADVFLDELPDYIGAERVYEQFSQSDALEKLQAFFPTVSQYRSWFERFRNAVLERIDEAREQEIEAERQEKDEFHDDGEDSEKPPENPSVIYVPPNPDTDTDPDAA